LAPLQRSGLSRSGFALRFSELVGEPPDSIPKVVAYIGYESESSFHKAFKRTLGPADAHRKHAA
jgi:hypothetical protein